MEEHRLLGLNGYGFKAKGVKLFFSSTGSVLQSGEKIDGEPIFSSTSAVVLNFYSSISG
jgi:hypothetical protein